MPTKAELIAQLTTYDDMDKGWGRKNIYGDPEHIKHLRGILALPHIQALSDKTTISLSYELIRLGIDYERVFSKDFILRSGGSASAKLFNAIAPKEPPFSELGFTSKETTPISEKIKNTLELLRDKLIFYITTVSSQPIFVLYKAEYLVSGLSGFSGLQRATQLLKIIELALSEYKRSGMLSLLFSKIHNICLGPHTRYLIDSDVTTLIDLIKEQLRIETSFTSSTYTMTLFDELITANRSRCFLQIAGRKILDKCVECHFTEELFLSFLEKYLIDFEFSFTNPVPKHFASDVFEEAFTKYLCTLERSERSSRISIASEKARSSIDIAGAGMGR